MKLVCWGQASRTKKRNEAVTVNGCEEAGLGPNCGRQRHEIAQKPQTTIVSHKSRIALAHKQPAADKAPPRLARRVNCPDAVAPGSGSANRPMMLSERQRPWGR
jgi:hypothetical protein